MEVEQGEHLGDEQSHVEVRADPSGGLQRAGRRDDLASTIACGTNTQGARRGQDRQRAPQGEPVAAIGARDLAIMDPRGVAYDR